MYIGQTARIAKLLSINTGVRGYLCFRAHSRGGLLTFLGCQPVAEDDLPSVKWLAVSWQIEMTHHPNNTNG
jgi:hypothetical protein